MGVVWEERIASLIAAGGLIWFVRLSTANFTALDKMTLPMNAIYVTAIGVVLWLCWTIAWMVRQVRIVRATRNGPLPNIGPIVVVWTAFFLFIGFVVGYQVFQNYIANAYFWLLSGLLFGAAALAKEKPPSGQEDPALGA